MEDHEFPPHILPSLPEPSPNAPDENRIYFQPAVHLRRRRDGGQWRQPAALLPRLSTDHHFHPHRLHSPATQTGRGRSECRREGESLPEPPRCSTLTLRRDLCRCSSSPPAGSPSGSRCRFAGVPLSPGVCCSWIRCLLPISWGSLGRLVGSVCKRVNDEMGSV